MGRGRETQKVGYVDGQSFKERCDDKHINLTLLKNSSVTALLSVDKIEHQAQYTCILRFSIRVKK